jgi:hypothetical protein
MDSNVKDATAAPDALELAAAKEHAAWKKVVEAEQIYRDAGDEWYEAALAVVAIIKGKA